MRDLLREKGIAKQGLVVDANGSRKIPVKPPLSRLSVQASSPYDAVEQQVGVGRYAEIIILHWCMVAGEYVALSHGDNLSHLSPLSGYALCAVGSWQAKLDEKLARGQLRGGPFKAGHKARDLPYRRGLNEGTPHCDPWRNPYLMRGVPAGGELGQVKAH